MKDTVQGIVIVKGYVTIFRLIKTLHIHAFVMLPISAFAEEPVSVNVYGINSGSAITYHYELQNNSGRSIT